MHKKENLQLVACLLSFGIVGASGIILNFFLLYGFGIEGVAIFNQFLALYFIGSQLTTFGIHQSTLSHTAASIKSVNIIVGALVITIFIAVIVSVLFFLFIENVFRPLTASTFAGDTTFLIPVLILAALNKVLISAFNGVGRLYKFAVANACRMLLLFLGIVIGKVLQVSAVQLTYSFLFSELCLFLFNLSCLIIDTRHARLSLLQVRYWMQKHFIFGKFAVLSGFIIDLNTKVDLLSLSLFVSQRDVGIYSFAAMLGEGFYQLIVVLKNYSSKGIAKSIQAGVKGLDIAYSKQQNRFMILISLAFVGCNILYFPAMQLLVTDQSFASEGFYIFFIYSCALAVFARWLVLDNFYILAKRPKLDNIMRVKIFLVNLVAAISLVPFFGNIGAVAAVAISIAANGLLVRAATLKTFTLASRSRGFVIPHLLRNLKIPSNSEDD